MKITICIGRSLTAMTRTLPPIHARGDPGRRGGPGGPNTAELRDGRRRLREPYPHGVAQEPRVVARRGNLRLAVEEPALFLADRLNFPARHLPPVCALAGPPVGRTSASTPAVAATSTGSRGR